jgi:uncharacterized protein (TIGR02466 family)
MSMNIQSMFAVPLGWTFLNDIDNNDLIEYSQKKLRSDGQSNKVDLSENPIKNLAEVVTKEVNKFHTTCGFKYSQKVLDAWCNQGNPEIICKPHTHPHAFFVAIYYLNKSDVELNFLNPINSLETLISPDIIETYNEYNRVYTTIPPAEGLLIIHPAWITHYVNNILDNRMSIAFNMVIDKNVSHDTVDKS